MKNNRIERYLAIAGAILCLVITLLLAIMVSQQQTMWPLPGMYFLEMLIISSVVVWFVMRGNPFRAYITWAACGIFSAFWLLGILSIGIFYLPIVLLFGVSGIFSEMTNRGHLLAHLVTFFLAGIVQAGVMLVLIQLL